MAISLSSKMLGDAGEHYALSQFSFAGLPSKCLITGKAMT